jgi:hypothetical protein
VALLRRVFYDLTGLPPSPEEVAAFLADDSPEALAKRVDLLLASPRYGEKWGRHWLDLVRYAETHGYERDSTKPFAWRYRDWVIEAFNEDKPYDRFLLEQLAGDELDDADAESVAATGYYRLGIWNDEPDDPLLAKYDVLDGVLSTTCQVAMAMTIGCARCHEHKKDPIPQRDYYRLLAFFQDVSEMNDRMTREIAGTGGEKLAVLAVAEKGRSPTHVFLRGNPELVGEEVTPGVPAVLEALVPLPTLRAPAPAATTSGKRRAFAEWLASGENPLVARTIANRLWQYHFGRGIVRTANDFGRLGELPTHPELLDWLACEVVASGWQLKRIHRLILSSSAYRMSSTPPGDDPRALAGDPANDLFWRYEMRRLSAEEIRDSILAVTGALHLKMGGPSFYPDLPAEVLQTSSKPAEVWGKSPPAEKVRRSVYIFIKRSLVPPLLAAHDLADTDSSCAVRFTTTVPTQALTLLNSEFISDAARRFAARLAEEAPTDLRSRIELGLRLVTCRRPRDEVLARALAMVEDLTSTGTPEREALEYFALLALNLNEFAYLD